MSVYIRPKGPDHLGGIVAQQKARNRAGWEYLKNPSNRRSFLKIAALTIFILVYNGIMLTFIGDIN